MQKKNTISIDLNVIVPILVGVIVLLGVYIIVNKKEHVRFADPVVTEEIIYQQPDYFVEPQPIFLQQPTFFNPNHQERGSTNMYNIQMKEAFNMPDLTSLFQTKQSSSMASSVAPSTMPSMNFASQTVPMNIAPMNIASMSNASNAPMIIPSPMESTPDSAMLTSSL
jgi:hypothetical protein